MISNMKYAQVLVSTDIARPVLVESPLSPLVLESLLFPSLLVLLLLVPVAL